MNTFHNESEFKHQTRLQYVGYNEWLTLIWKTLASRTEQILIPVFLFVTVFKSVFNILKCSTLGLPPGHVILTSLSKMFCNL